MTSQFGDMLKRMNNKPKGENEKNESIQLSADASINKQAEEYRETIERAKKYMEEQGMVEKEYLDENSGEFRLGIFRKDNSTMSFDELWEATDLDYQSMSPEEQRELKDFWDRYKIEFKEPNPLEEVEQFDDYFKKMMGGGEKG